VKTWECPKCPAQARTVDEKVPMHVCPALGLLVPLLVVGGGSNLLVVERGDYVGKEDVQLDVNGRPVMAVVTRHSDGSEDRTVYAPTATTDAR